MPQPDVSKSLTRSVDGVARQLLGGYADVTRGGGLKYDQVTFLGPGGTVRAELRLKKGHVRKLEQVGFASQVGASRLRLQGAPNRQRVAPPFEPVFKDEWFLNLGTPE